MVQVSNAEILICLLRVAAANEVGLTLYDLRKATKKSMKDDPGIRSCERLLNNLFEGTELEQSANCAHCHFEGNYEIKVSSWAIEPSVEFPIREPCDNHRSATTQPATHDIQWAACSAEEKELLCSEWAWGTSMACVAKLFGRGTPGRWVDIMDALLESGIILRWRPDTVPVICCRIFQWLPHEVQTEVVKAWLKAWTAEGFNMPEKVLESRSEVLMRVLNDAIKKKGLKLPRLKEIAIKSSKGNSQDERLLDDLFRIAECQERNDKSKSPFL